MLTNEFFYTIFWIVTLSIIWFRTDWFVHYSQLFGMCESLRLQFTKFIQTNSNYYFPDFLYKVSLKIACRWKKFLLKLISCPFCLLFWLSCIGALILNSLVLIGPIYVASLALFLILLKLI